MPKCVFCCSKVNSLILQYGEFKVLAHCQKCGNLADQYQEYDFVLKLLDLMLQKAEIYRHFLALQLSKSIIIRFGLLITVFEIYINYMIAEESHSLAIISEFTLLDKIIFYSIICLFHKLKYGKLVAVPLLFASYPILFILSSILWQFHISTDYLFVYALKLVRRLSQIQVIRLYTNSSYMEALIVVFLTLLIKYQLLLEYDLHPMLTL